ncbi:MAG: hypothetical protein Ta2B_12190 [Termitinemataceae bacterium]|nr:MAG: hypothetical protein Ta2B_12190 [Termitinemataceae bacterium]
MQRIILNADEILVLMDHNTVTEGGGWQDLFRKLQGQFDIATNEITLFDDDIIKIGNYAKGISGWQGKLRKIFARTLGIQQK